MRIFSKGIRAAFAALIGCFIGAFAVLSLSAGAGASADAEGGEDYYYSQLTAEAKRFYDAISEMERDGSLKKGNAEYDLIGGGTLTAAQLSSYSRSADVLVAFGAARDAYYLDHPEVFYVDFSYLSVSVGTKNGEYVATLGTGRSDNYYIEGGFESESEVNEAIGRFSAAVQSIADEADAADSVAEKIRIANALLIERTEYSFCSTAEGSGTTYLDGAAFIRNPYGALVNGKSVCEGYARAFKVIMNKLGIGCVLVQGYACVTENGYEPHAWNYVQADGNWYGVDATWNDGEGASPDSYLLRGNALMKLEHIPDGIISEGGFEFRYPALAAYDYGVSEDVGGLTIESRYESNGESGAMALIFKISYNGKGAERLADEDGLYLAYRYGYEADGETVWSGWLSVCEITGGADFGTYTEFYGANTYVQYVQFSLIDYAPDVDPVSGGSNKYAYDPDKLTDRHLGNVSELHGNAAYGTYAAPPYVKSATPDNGLPIKADGTYEIVVTYTEPLKLKDETKPAEVRFVSQHDDAAEYAEITDVVWDAAQPDRISFRFRPSRMYQHRYESYSFYFVNLVGVESEKAPASFCYLTEQPNVVCNRIFGDGRLYIKAYGEPAFTGTGDLSLDGWTDENGNFVAENQRSQLMLVVTRPGEEQSGDMTDAAAEKAGAEKSDVLASETYELQLSICGNIARIPNGSYMQLAFGFPAGYGPDDAGVTFKVYHFKRDENGEIDFDLTEELDCVITEYGLVVTVTDFSPFAVVVLPKDKASAGKGIYARTVGFGGSMEGSGIARLAENDSVTYTFSPDSGYRVDRVLLNGEAVAVENDSLTLSYAQLRENNTLEAYFVAERVAGREAAEGISVVYPSLSLVLSDGGTTVCPAAPDDGSQPWIVFLIVGICVVLAAAVVLAVFIAQKRRRRGSK